VAIPTEALRSTRLGTKHWPIPAASRGKLRFF
jgi:hypothetical protein